MARRGEGLEGKGKVGREGKSKEGRMLDAEDSNREWWTGRSKGD